MRISFKKYSFIISLFITAYVSAQKLPFDNYNIKNGLPSNFVWDIEQDNKGYMWFATQLGVSRFDGYEFENFGIDRGLPSNDIHCIYPDSKGFIWFGSYGDGLSRFDGYHFKNYTISEGLIDNNIKFIFEDHEGGIWAASQNGISRIYIDSITNLTTSSGLLGNHVICNLIDKEGDVWLGTSKGFCRLEVRGDNIQIKENGLLDKNVYDMKFDNENNIWMALEKDGIFKYEKENKYLTPVTSPFSELVICLESDQQGNIWYGTFKKGAYKINIKTLKIDPINITSGKTIRKIVQDKTKRMWLISVDEGLYYLSNKTLKYVNTNNNLIDNHVMDIQVDIEGNIWIATISGISKYGKKPFEIYTKEFGLPQKDVLDVYADNNENIWIGTYGGLSVLTRTNEIINYNINNPVSDDVFSIMEDRKNNLWLGTFRGLTRFINNKFMLLIDTILLTVSEENSYINDIIEDTSGNIWATHDQGLSKLMGRDYVNFTVKDGLPGNECIALAIDSTSNIWIATSNGVALYNENKFIKFNKDDGLSENNCNDICVGNNGDIWIATDYGLNRLVWNGKNIMIDQIFTTQDGLASNAIMFVEIDKSNNLWVGHEKGLNKINLINNKITYYGYKEGFTPLETYRGSVSVDQMNNLWIGTVEGLVKYISKNDQISLIPPRTYIRKILLYNDSTNIFRYSSGLDSLSGMPIDLKLPYHKSSIVFEYIGLHFSLPEKNLYQYMLNGYDDSWSESTTNTFTDPYRKLPAGHYTFMLKAANSDGLWIEEPVTYSFTITPPFWQTTWAYIAEILIGLGLFYLIIRLRERKLQQDKRILAQKVKERTIEIEKQRDHIALQNREITDSIMYAKRIQSAVLPKEEVIKIMLPDHFILFKPRDIVSGDFYWTTKKDNKIFVVVSDCTGHGVPGAFMSMLGVSLLNEIINKPNDLSACDILNQLRDNIKRTLSQTGRQDETKDGMDMVISIIDFAKMKIQFAGAYNSLWIIHNNELLVYKGDKMPIGIYVGTEKSFTCYDIDIHKGDVLYMFSDGYADQFGGPEEKKFKSGTLKDLLLQIYKKPLEEQKAILNLTIEDWKGDLQQVDDIMVMGIKI